MLSRVVIVVALVGAVLCQDVQPTGSPASSEEPAGTSFVPPQAPRPAKLTPLTVDAGQFAQVDLQPDGGPLKVQAPLTKLHVNRQTGDVNLRAGPLALDLDTAKDGKPFGLWIDIPRIFNLRIGHPADGGKGVNVDIPILREVGDFLRGLHDQGKPSTPTVAPTEFEVTEDVTTSEISSPATVQSSSTIPINESSEQNVI